MSLFAQGEWEDAGTRLIQKSEDLTGTQDHTPPVGWGLG